MARFRNHGWEPNELKIYWNVTQLENLCPKHGTEAEPVKEKDQDSETKLEGKVETQGETKVETQTDTMVEAKDEIKIEVKGETKDENLPPYDPSDADVVEALRQYPVTKRNHLGTITYVNKGIEKAVFDAPEDVQLIVLNFAVSCSFRCRS